MGKLILIAGANDSGKSLYGEQLAAGFDGPKFYIATMIPQTEENHLRIEKHRQQRAGMGFQTLELPYMVSDASVTENGVVLLEDVSNLLANAVFEKKRDMECVFRDICALRDRCRCVIAVTISGLCAEGFDGGTTAYINALNELNQKLYDHADAAITMRDRMPHTEKGDVHAFDSITFCRPVYIQRDPGSSV